jgi:hypothetical protein
MSFEELQRCVLDLPDSDRALLAAELLVSLPSVLVDEDDGIAEAIRRSKELDDHPSMGCTWDEIKKSLAR